MALYKLTDRKDNIEMYFTTKAKAIEYIIENYLTEGQILDKWSDFYGTFYGIYKNEMSVLAIRTFSIEETNINIIA